MRRQQKIKEKSKQEELQKRAELLRRIETLVALLLQYKSDVNAEGEGGWTLLHIACQEQTVVEIVEKLLVNGAHRNQRTHTGKTGFHVVCEAGNVKVVQHLRAHEKTDVDAKDNFGNSPLLAAASCGHKDVVNLLTPWAERQTRDLSKEAEAAAKQVYATVVDFGGYKRGNEVRKVKVYDLLHSDPSADFKVSSSTVCKGPTVFRWIHLPANNDSWCQDLLTKRFIEEGAEDEHGFKALQRSFLYQHDGQKWHSNYMRPGCQAVPRSKKAASPEQGTTPRLSVSFSPQSDASSQFSGHAVPPEDSKQVSYLLDPGGSGGPDSTRKPELVRTDTAASTKAGALSVPEDADLTGQPNRRRAMSFSHDHGLVRADTVGSRAGRSNPETSRRVIINQLAPSTEHNVYMFAPYLHFETDLQRREMQEVAKRATGDLYGKQVKFGPDHPIHQTTPDELLMRAYLRPPISGLDVRRTLGQSFYRTIDTDFRDKTQVVYHYAQKHGGSQETLKVLMVDQLWMWIVGKDLIITSFPQNGLHYWPSAEHAGRLRL